MSVSFEPCKPGAKASLKASLRASGASVWLQQEITRREEAASASEDGTILANGLEGLGSNPWDVPLKERPERMERTLSLTLSRTKPLRPDTPGPPGTNAVP